MNYLTTGIFYGDTFKTLKIDGMTITDTEYTHDWVDWHYHENTYFTFLLEGRLIEGNKKEKHICSPGTLLYHSCQEPHYNIKPAGYARGFHVEINGSWLESMGLGYNYPIGSFCINNPGVISLFRKIHNELSIGGSSVEIEYLLSGVYLKLLNSVNEKGRTKPSWLKEITEMMNEGIAEKLSFKEIAQFLNIHPVHLSRDFKKHFNCSMGEYVRKLKIQKALKLMSAEDLTLTQIAHTCGFADQSHFIKWFRFFIGTNPLHYRKQFTR